MTAPRTGAAAGWLCMAAALLLGIVPVPPTLVERWYSRALYPPWQRAMTSASNALPFSCFDVLCLAALFAATATIVRTVRRRGWRRAPPPLAWRFGIAAAVIYLAFLVGWGFNYRRVPLRRQLAFDAGRLTPSATVALARRSVDEMNRLHGAAHAATMSTSDLARAFHDAQRALGAPVPIVPGRPKRTLLGPYFHQAAISGMTDPFFLETMLAPDLLNVEKPFVIAHEWGHLAGYADESEASFIGFLACMRGPAAAQYSGWLEMFEHAVAAVPGGDRRAILEQLGPGPRADLEALAARYARTSPAVRHLARSTYDRYLRANRVPNGIASYDAVLNLVLGTRFGPGWTPELK